MSQAKETVQKYIDDNAVVVFSKTYCPYCKATKQTLKDLGADFLTVELDTRDDGAALQDALEEISGQRSVPNNYISKKHIWRQLRPADPVQEWPVEEARPGGQRHQGDRDYYYER
ncbi:glutaredoxin [Verticillium alfalfae VaMs.102]|uniref:Glutaredoxin n=1 Tax=Verticillium alfalfae (strain VaMs.102 / ATCC MYA-4576 / FGSC 10136) TaxID=526221 RepID=C9SVX7_VERA1|nr:glutaredoxin [Verticillium alfalfae VaMs.102]EEY22942.1 glutaredoxin [Verticillium alfalfae VaMs.102]